MPKRRPPAKKSQRRATKPKGRRHRRRITPAQARRLAARHTLALMFDGATVTDGADGYGSFMRDRIAEAWLFFPKIQQEQGIISPPRVVMVCNRTGSVLYAGPARDEG